VATVQSFNSISAPDARILILGSMPGRLSLERQEYYAHPQNLFWRFMGELFGAFPVLSYPDRVQILRSRGVAVWDVLKQCEREGSMDSDIDVSTMLVNDFPTFFAQHPSIRCVLFNGAKAESVYHRLVLPELDRQADMPRFRLPSTSPANASMPTAIKLETWRDMLKRA
jgi:hypoxanthine-DNA glycosylase